jgi:phosphatidylinositol glycan class V
MISASAATSRPLQSLVTLFLAWKIFLLAIATGTALASDYDTSTSLFFERVYGSSSSSSSNSPSATPHPPPPAFLAGRLTRWDAIYFVHASHAGYVYEQEWAFGTGLPATVGLVQRTLAAVGFGPVSSQEALIAIAIAHVSHLLAVLGLYKLTVLVAKDKKLAFVASALHILSPAGLFMSAPYGESPCSCLSFVGNLLFAYSLVESSSASTFRSSLLKIAAGISIGLAVAFRSNAILGGLLFAVDAVEGLLKFATGPSLSKLCLLGATVVGGLCIAAGLIIPQAIAWKQFCHDAAPGVELRPWCTRTIPSIYAFVQEFYW